MKRFYNLCLLQASYNKYEFAQNLVCIFAVSGKSILVWGAINPIWISKVAQAFRRTEYLEIYSHERSLRIVKWENKLGFAYSFLGYGHAWCHCSWLKAHWEVQRLHCLDYAFSPTSVNELLEPVGRKHLIKMYNKKKLSGIFLYHIVISNGWLIYYET